MEEVVLTHLYLTDSSYDHKTSSLMPIRPPIPNPPQAPHVPLTKYILTHLHSLFQPSHQVLLQFLQPHSPLQPSYKQFQKDLPNSSSNLRCYHFLHTRCLPWTGNRIFTCVPPVKEKRYKYLLLMVGTFSV